MMKKITCLKSGKNNTDLNSYAGNWIALVNNKPIASAKNLSILMQKVKKQRLSKDPSVMLVPRKDEGPYILIML